MVTGLPDWMVNLVNDIGIDLGPDKNDGDELLSSREGLLQVGPLTGFSNIGQQAVICLLSDFGDIRNVTVHVKCPGEGEIT